MFLLIGDSVYNLNMSYRFKNIILVAMIIMICSFTLAILLIGANKTRLVLSEQYRDRATLDAGNKYFYLNLSLILDPSEQRILDFAYELYREEHYSSAQLWLHVIDSDGAKELLGNILLKQDDYRGAEVAFNKIKNSERKAFLKAKTYAISGDIRKASQYLLQIKPSLESCQIRILIAADTTACSGVDLPSEYRAIVEVFPSPRAYKSAYNLASSLNYPQLSLALLQRAIDLGLADRDIYFELANRHFELGDYALANDFYLRASKIDPFYPQAYQQLVEVSQKLGNAEAAEAYKERLDILTVQ